MNGPIQGSQRVVQDGMVGIATICGCRNDLFRMRIESMTYGDEINTLRFRRSAEARIFLPRPRNGPKIAAPVSRGRRIPADPTPTNKWTVHNVYVLPLNGRWPRAALSLTCQFHPKSGRRGLRVYEALPLMTAKDRASASGRCQKPARSVAKKVISCDTRTASGHRSYTQSGNRGNDRVYNDNTSIFCR
ncbi:unnamed protein product, partial [Iphiclides podalirius]